jgi:hypothetical protein
MAANILMNKLKYLLPYDNLTNLNIKLTSTKSINCLNICFRIFLVLMVIIGFPR